MPAAVLVPLIIGAASTAGTVAAAKMSANAARDAANLQTVAGNKALGLEQQQFQAAQARAQPWSQAGQQALSRLQGMSDSARPPMPMFNGALPGGGWTPQNFGMSQPVGVSPNGFNYTNGPQSAPMNPYAKMMQQPGGQPPPDLPPDWSRTNQMPWPPRY